MNDIKKVLFYIFITICFILIIFAIIKYIRNEKELTEAIEKLQSAENRIHKRIVISGSTKIFVTGFSLGGAIAVLCAIDIQYNNLCEKIICVPLGSPRIGNK